MFSAQKQAQENNQGLPQDGSSALSCKSLPKEKKEKQKEVAIDEDRHVYIFNSSAICQGRQLIHPALTCFYKIKETENEEKIENREREKRDEKEEVENKEDKIDLPVHIILPSHEFLRGNTFKLDQESFILKCGNTEIKIPQGDYEKMLNHNHEAFMQFIAIFTELDKAKLKIFLPQNKTEGLFVNSIETPSDYSLVHPQQIIVIDERPSVCAALRKMGFTVIDADTQATRAYHEGSVNSYLTHLWETLPADEKPKMGEVAKFKHDSTQEKRPVAILDLNLLIQSDKDADGIINMLKRDNMTDLYLLHEFNFTDNGSSQMGKIKHSLALLAEKGFRVHAILSQHDLKRPETYNRLGHVFRQFVRPLRDEVDAEKFSSASNNLEKYIEIYHDRAGPADVDRDEEQEVLAYFIQHQPEWVESCVLYTATQAKEKNNSDKKSLALEEKTVRIPNSDALLAYENSKYEKCKKALEEAIALFQVQAKENQEAQRGDEATPLFSALNNLKDALFSEVKKEDCNVKAACDSLQRDIIIKTTNMLTTLHVLQSKAKVDAQPNAKAKNLEQTQAAILQLIKNYERECRQSPAWTYYMPEIVAVISTVTLFAMGLVISLPAAPLLAVAGFFAGKEIGKQIERKCFTRYEFEKHAMDIVNIIKLVP